ncbi:MAG: hypothetical protein AMJ90_03420 [candidate division Zixibacteria bacterium SM23_73_2]|nr:MAG: hypothetical protein AMJ90_03420 [candidate division Zixibacteria bacterium SM23_73_2]
MLEIKRELKNIDLFDYKRIECPVCGKINRFKTLKQKAYTERERDTDFRPKKLLWRDSRYQNLNPLLHFMACCRYCFYTREFDRDYQGWKKNQHFREALLPAIRKNHLKLLRKEDSIIKKIGNTLSPELYPFETAVLKLLLGIVDEDLNPEKQNLNLARYYLRIAWLFRDEKERALQLRRKTKKDLNEGFNRALLSQEEYRSGIKKLQDGVESFLKQIKVSAKTDILKSFNRMERKVNSTKKALEHLRSLIQKENEKVFMDYSNFEDFLFYLKIYWQDVPTNENEALELAFKYYQKNLKENRLFNQKIQASYLLGDISKRIGNLDNAKRYFDLAMRLGEDFLHKHKDDMVKTALAHKVLELSKSQYRSLKTL